MTDKVTLRKHQEAGVEFLRRNDIAAILHARGLGKTITVLSELEERFRAGTVKRVLYVAPLSTLENVRREAFRVAPSVFPQMLVGGRAMRTKAIEKPGLHNMDLINYEGLRVCAETLMDAGYDAVVYDESTRIKDRDTKVSTIARMIGAKARIRRILTGMPFTEGVEDAWAQFQFLSPTIFSDNFYSFRNRYCVMATRFIEVKVKNRFTGKGERVKRKFHEITGYRNLDEFTDRIAGVTHYAKKEDCLDLPPKTYQVLHIPMLEDQEKRYRIVEKETFSELDGKEITHAVALAKIQKLRQVAAGFLYDDEHVPVQVPSAKYAELEDFIRDTLYGKEKMVVFTSFRAEPEMVEGVIAGIRKPRVRCFRLAENPLERQPGIDQWSQHDGAAVLVANARSGGVGLNLMAAATAVFLSNDWRMEDREQAEDRVHRMGSEIHKKILIADFVTTGTVEEDILEALQSKKNVVEIFLAKLKARMKGGDA